MTPPRRRLGAGALAALGLLLAVALLGLAVHVDTSITGRGGRPVSGTRHVVQSTAGYDLVYYEQAPAIGAADPTPIVLLASFARSVADLNELAASLAAAGYRTLAVESRGIGGSGGGGPGRDLTLHDLAADLGDVLDVEAPGRAAHLVGHAFGNRVVRTFARDQPQRAASVTLIAAGGLVPIAPEILEALQDSVASFLPRRVREPALRLAFFSPKSRIPPDWVGGWWLWGGLAQRRATASTPSSDFWDAGRAPVLVLQAEDDRLAPPEDSGLRLAREFPERIELVTIPDAGHAFLPEQPERIRTAMLAYYSRFRSRP